TPILRAKIILGICLFAAAMGGMLFVNVLHSGTLPMRAAAFLFYAACGVCATVLGNLGTSMLDAIMPG
ncbi:MAG: hypothetical protein PHC61_07005, partial [Chitinivibrionales bacterium]|nr:hypothetical protein [Chitinivibrionales bacterium]